MPDDPRHQSTDPVIVAAVDAAAEACRDASHMCATGDLAALSKCMTTKAWQPCRCKRQAVAAVAAFLRALPGSLRNDGALWWAAIPAHEETALWLADAAERAAQETRNA